MNPALILSLIAVPLGAALMLWGSLPVVIAGMAIVGLVLAVDVFQLLWFTFTAPDRLQHDQHVERMEVIRQRGISVRSGDQVTELPVPANAALVENPKAPGDE